MHQCYAKSILLTLMRFSIFTKNSVFISLLDPFRNHELLKQLSKYDISALSLDMIPRITRAQKMDVLSSQASLAGYVAIVKASAMLPKVLPMMMTPCGNNFSIKKFYHRCRCSGTSSYYNSKTIRS